MCCSMQRRASLIPSHILHQSLFPPFLPRISGNHYLLSYPLLANECMRCALQSLARPARPTLLLNWGSIPLLNLPPPSRAPCTVHSLSSPRSEFSNTASNPRRGDCGRSKSHRLRGSMVREEYHWHQARKLSIIDRHCRHTSYSYLA